MDKNNTIKEFYLNIVGAFNDTEHKHMIIPSLSIGDHYSSYQKFKIIINADFPNNFVKHNKIKKYDITGDFLKHTIYSIGIYDGVAIDLLLAINELIPYLKEEYKNRPNARILFHCYAGKSRSVCLAIAYLIEVRGVYI